MSEEREEMENSSGDAINKRGAERGYQYDCQAGF